VPLHTLRAAGAVGIARATTTSGTCGVKVWVCKGEIMAHAPMAVEKRALEQQGSGPSGGRRESAEAR